MVRPMIEDSGPMPLVADLIKATLENPNFRTTVRTGEHMQLTLMRLRPGEDIGREVHAHTDQFLFVVSGTGKAVLDSRIRPIKPGDAIFVPAGVAHNLVNTGRKSLRLFSLYAPPEHPRGTVHPTKADVPPEEY